MNKKGAKTKTLIKFIFNPLTIGFSVTLFLICIYVLVGLQEFSNSEAGSTRTMFEEFLSSRPNEIGDTLAGLAGVLAILWIIVSVMLQRKEYSNMVSVLDAQARIFDDERIYRDELRAKNLLDARLEELEGIIDSASSYKWKYKTEIRVGRNIEYINNERDLRKTKLIERAQSLVSCNSQFEGGITLSEQYLHLADNLKKVLDAVSTKHVDYVPPKEPFERLQISLNSLVGLEDKLAEDQKLLLSMLNLDKLSEELDKALSSNIWKTVS